MPNRREFIVATATHLPKQQATMYTSVDYICASIEVEALYAEREKLLKKVK